jgi:predicted RNase H-like HicB family nuclease
LIRFFKAVMETVNRVDLCDDEFRVTGEIAMKAEFTAIIEAAPEGGYWAICPEIPGANGQGETIEETKNNLRHAIELILEDRKADILRGIPDAAIKDTVMVG